MKQIKLSIVSESLGNLHQLVQIVQSESTQRTDVLLAEGT